MTTLKTKFDQLKHFGILKLFSLSLKMIDWTAKNSIFPDSELLHE